VISFVCLALHRRDCLLLGHSLGRFLVNGIRKVSVFKLLFVVEQELVIFVDLLFDLRERTDWTSNSHACGIDLFHLVLSYLVLFQSVDQFLANTHDVSREMSPLHLRLIQRFLGEVLFLLKHDHSFLHLRESI
jgi:hypothetical protein